MLIQTLIQKKNLERDKLVVPKKKGNAPIDAKIIHEISSGNKKADRISTSLSFLLKIKETFNPVNKQTIDITKNTTQSVPP